MTCQPTTLVSPPPWGALGLPTEEAALLALRTQQVIAHESGVAEHPDPLGGAYVLEKRTAEIIDEARDYIRRIEEMGGARVAIERGFQQNEIADAAYETQLAIERDEQVVVGVNRFQLEEESSLPIMTIDDRVERQQVQRLRAIREARPQQPVKANLDALRQAAGDDRNLMPPILDCVKAEVTLGEISDVLRDVWGEYEESTSA